MDAKGGSSYIQGLLDFLGGFKWITLPAAACVATYALQQRALLTGWAFVIALIAENITARYFMPQLCFLKMR